MGPRPASPSTEHTLRQGLLISALLLTFWNPLTTAQLTTESVPRHAVEGKSLLLQVNNLPDNLQGYFWYRGEIAPSNVIARLSLATNKSFPGNAYTGKETIHHNGSLLIEKITMNDTGVYITQTMKTDFDTEAASLEIHVYQLVTEPSIKATNTTVQEQGSVTFTCLSNDTEISIQWIFNNQNLPSIPRITLSNDNRSLSIDPVVREDAGDYQCEISNPVSSKKSNPVHLSVINQSSQGGLPVWTVVITVTGGLVLILVTALGCFLFLTKTSRYPGSPHTIHPRWIETPSLTSQDALHSSYQHLSHQLLT